MSFVEFSGTARLDRRTKHLVKRLGSNDIAIIDHADLDRISAEELLESGVRVVVNVAPSTTGTYPNAGPLALVRGGVRLIDAPGVDLFEEIKDGEQLIVRGASLFRNGTRLAAGHALSAEELESALSEQRGRVSEALESFAENTLRHIREETTVLSEGVQLPQLRTVFR
ncbi:MAG: putative cytokinetic ring protein SteA, partial [Gaiellaceae bacterium]